MCGPSQAGAAPAAGRVPVRQAAGHVVDEGVEAAVGAGQREHHGVQGLGGLGQQAALQQAHVGECVAKQVEVVGCEAEQEHPQHPVDDGEGVAMPVVVLPRAGVVVAAAGRLAAASPRLPPEHAQHAAVAEEQQQRRHLERSLDQHQRRQDEGPVLARGRVQQTGLVVLGGGGSQQGQCQAERQHQAPDAHADEARRAHAPQPLRQRVHHGEVAVHANAHQEEDAPVQADVLQRERQLAEDAPRVPVRGRVHL